MRKNCIGASGVIHVLIMMLFATMCALILLMTLSRITGLFTDRFLWAEEASRYLMIWLSFLAVIHAARTNSHFRMTALVGSIKSPIIRKTLGVTAAIVSTGIMSLVLYYGYNLIMRQVRSGQSSPVMHLPMWIAYLAIPVGMAGMLFWTVVNEIGALTGKSAKGVTEAAKEET